jgi:hypothetical protein
MICGATGRGAIDPTRSLPKRRWLFTIVVQNAADSRWEGTMPAYLIAEHTINDPAKFEVYRVKVGPLIAKHGGRYITKAVVA